MVWEYLQISHCDIIILSSIIFLLKAKLVIGTKSFKQLVSFPGKIFQNDFFVNVPFSKSTAISYLQPLVELLPSLVSRKFPSISVSRKKNANNDHFSDGNVMAINPGEDPKMQMFIWNNIFFSLGFDVRDHYKDLGGDAAAFVAPRNDLQGVKVYNAVDLEGLYTLGTVVVDYRGYRYVAPQIIIFNVVT